MHSKRRRHSVLCVSSAGVRNLGWSISASRSYRLTVVHECHCRFRAGVGGPSPSCWEGLRLLFLEFGSGARHAGPKPEAQSAESGVRFLGVGSHLEGLWKRCKLPSGARGRGPAAICFLCSRGARRPLIKLVGAKLGAWPTCPSLKFVYACMCCHIHVLSVLDIVTESTRYIAVNNRKAYLF